MFGLHSPRGRHEEKPDRRGGCGTDIKEKKKEVYKIEVYIVYTATVLSSLLTEYTDGINSGRF